MPQSRVCPSGYRILFHGRLTLPLVVPLMEKQAFPFYATGAYSRKQRMLFYLNAPTVIISKMQVQCIYLQQRYTIYQT